MPANELATSHLNPNGDRLLTPNLGDSAQSVYRIVLEGVFRCDVNGVQFDALYKTGPDGAFMQPHAYLQWTPRTPILESADTARHRYVFRVPAEWRLDGQSVGVRVDVDQFVNELLIPPSEVRDSLSGGMAMTLTQTAIAPPSLWPYVGIAAVPAALAVVGLGVVIRRRQALGGLAYDLQTQLGNIEQKFRAALAVARKGHSAQPGLEERLQAVRTGAFALARQIQDLRNAQGSLDRRILESDVKRLERQMETLADNAARREGEVTLTEKRKSLALISELEQAESRCTMRLTKIEAVLDTVCLTLRNPTSFPADAPPAEETLRQELDAEAAAIREVARELAASETLHQQVLHRSA